MKYKLEIDARITQAEPHYQPGLQIRETVEIEASTFMELAMILGHFHTLSEILKTHKRVHIVAEETAGSRHASHQG